MCSEQRLRHCREHLWERDNKKKTKQKLSDPETKASKKKEQTTARGDRMSFLSDQQPGSPFSDYSEVCKEPSLSPTELAHTWDWQPTPSLDTRTQRSLTVGSGAPATTGLTYEDKLCFSEQPCRGNEDLKVPGKVGVVPGSPSLGSVGESPVSPLSSSLSPSLALPERLSSGLACGGTTRASPEQPHAMGASLTEESLANVDSLSEAWNNLSFGECSPVVATPQASLNDREEVTGREAISSVGSPKADSEEEESPSEPVFKVQQREVMLPATSECSHLPVPTTLELPARYPGEKDMELNQPVSTISRSGCSPNSMQRSLTAADDQPPTPPSCQPAGVTEVDLWQDLPEPRLGTPPLSLLNASKAASSPSPPNDPVEDLKVEKELGGLGHPTPPRSRGVSSFDISSPPSAGTDTEEETCVHEHEFAAFHHANSDLEASDLDVVRNSRVGGDRDDGLTAGSFNNKGVTSCSSFIAVDGRWSLILMPLLCLALRKISYNKRKCE